uniref:Transposase n=1 Tax=Heterorhabditis bacteriophora TaxID=37862 RepID=A0A1I7XG72_HETBA
MDRISNSLHGSIARIVTIRKKKRQWLSWRVGSDIRSIEIRKLTAVTNLVKTINNLRQSTLRLRNKATSIKNHSGSDN